MLLVSGLEAVPICFHAGILRDVGAFITNWLSGNAHIEVFV
jgi:hypothetical protein